MIWPSHFIRRLSFTGRLQDSLKLFSLGLVREELSGLLPRGCEPSCQDSRRWVEEGGWQSYHFVCRFSLNLSVFNMVASSLSILMAVYPESLWWDPLKGKLQASAVVGEGQSPGYTEWKTWGNLLSTDKLLTRASVHLHFKKCDWPINSWTFLSFCCALRLLLGLVNQFIIQPRHFWERKETII